MSSAAILDFTSLLAPIAGESPVGPDLRRDFTPNNPYRQIKDLRTGARRVETHAAWEEGGSAEKPDWRPILDGGVKLIATRAKDLEVAAWITEALIRLEGFAGVRDGFRLCRELVEQFWDHLHPNPDPEEPEDPDEGLIRVAALAGLNGSESEGTLIAPILAVSIVESDEFGPIGTAAYEQAAALERIENPAERAKRIEHGTVPLENIHRAVGASSTGFYKRLLEDLSEAKHEFAGLCTALESRCGPGQAPPSSNIRQTLDDCLRRVMAIAPPSVTAGAAAPAAATAEAGPTKATSGGRRVNGPIATRDEAFEAIRQVAEFFRETEPHSVLSWQLDECVRWGRMTLPDLLADLIQDSAARESVYRRVGIPLPTASTG